MDKSNFEKWKTDIISVVSNSMQTRNMPGLSISVVNRHEILYERGFGFRNLKERLAATPNTLYGIGSLTKSFTALAIMMLVGEKKIDLNDPVAKYLDFQLDKFDTPITIQHLLSHSSGIPDLGIAKIILGGITEIIETYIPMQNWEDFLVYVNNAHDEVLFPPGERYYYFNGGYTILGKIIEIVSGQKFEQFITTRILEPLQMKRSTFSYQKMKKDEDCMNAYYVKNDQNTIQISSKPHPSNPFINAAGGLVSSVSELSNYLMMLLNAGKFQNIQIISPESIHQLQIPHITTPHVLPDYNCESGYASGWVVSKNFYGKTLVHHNGSTIVSCGLLLFSPELDIGIALLGNNGNADALFPIAKTIITKIIGLSEDLEKYEQHHTAGKINLQHYVGKYESYRKLKKLQIQKQKGYLIIKSTTIPDWNNLVLVPKLSSNTEHSTLFQLLNPTGKGLTFEFYEKNGTMHLIFERNLLKRVF